MRFRAVMSVVYDFFQVACALSMAYYGIKGDFEMSTRYGVNLIIFLLLQSKYT